MITLKLQVKQLSCDYQDRCAELNAAIEALYVAGTPQTKATALALVRSARALQDNAAKSLHHAYELLAGDRAPTEIE